MGLVILAVVIWLWGSSLFDEDEEPGYETPVAIHLPGATPLSDATVAPALFSAELTLDNRSAACHIEAGTWDGCHSEACDGIPYAADFIYADPGCEACRASCNFLIAQEGLYDVWAWWPRATDMPFTLVYGGRETTIAVNQRDQGNNWYPLATLSLAKDEKLSVIVGGSKTGSMLTSTRCN